MLDKVVLGASVSLTAKEADALCGDGPIRLVTCANGRVVGGIGQVGLVEHVRETDLDAFMAEIKAKRAELKTAADRPASENPRANLFTFTRI